MNNQLTSGRHCPVCNTDHDAFSSFGHPVREDAGCPNCHSLERHRLVWFYFQRHTDLFDGHPKRMLHIAPEKSFVSRLGSALGEGYLTADIQSGAAMAQIDITEVPYPEETFDVIYCSHVLEHVSDDLKAMSELCRVLKPNGWAVLLVPIITDKTHEDKNVTDPLERARLYGQSDHVRAYGPDYVDRLTAAGFTVRTFLPQDLATPAEITLYGLTPPSGDIFFCRKAVTH